MPHSYQAPSLRAIGSVAELTLRPHTHPSCTPSHPCEKNNSKISDGVDFQGQPLNFS